MATAADVAAHAAAQDNVVALAQADLARWWRSVDASDAREVAAALQRFLPDLVAAYGDMAASVAADWYDELRLADRVPGNYRAGIADVAPKEQAEAAARWAAGPMFGGDGAQAALEHAAGAVQRLVLQPGRGTIGFNVRRDPARPRWARVPSGRTSCAFCLMVAGRGAVYATRESAGGGMRAWHNHCRCRVVPVWKSSRLPYDPKRLEKAYEDARKTVGSSDLKKILAQMRLDLDID